MKDDKPRPPPSPESLKRLSDFARQIISVPKAQLDAKVRQVREQRKRDRRKAEKNT